MYLYLGGRVLKLVKYLTIPKQADTLKFILFSQWQPSIDNNKFLEILKDSLRINIVAVRNINDIKPLPTKHGIFKNILTFLSIFFKVKMTVLLSSL